MSSSVNDCSGLNSLSGVSGEILSSSKKKKRQAPLHVPWQCSIHSHMFSRSRVRFWMKRNGPGGLAFFSVLRTPRMSSGPRAQPNLENMLLALPVPVTTPQTGVRCGQWLGPIEVPKAVARIDSDGKRLLDRARTHACVSAIRR